MSQFQCVPRSILQTAPPRWLNVVIDINRILCQCVHLSSLKKNSATCHPRNQLYVPDIPAKVPPKAVYCRLRVRGFLESMSAHVAWVVI